MLTVKQAMNPKLVKGTGKASKYKVGKKLPNLSDFRRNVPAKGLLDPKLRNGVSIG